MHEIQLVVVKLIRIVLIASLVPMLGLLIIAAFNERVRRTLLWITAPSAVIAVIAYLILAPHKMATVEDLNQGAAVLKNAFLAGLPFILVFAVIGVGAYLFGPSIRDRLASAIQTYARGEYLAALLDWVKPQMVGMVELEARKIPAEITNHLRITGAPGSGKSVLLRSLLHERARRALSNANEPLPFWVDLDERLNTSTSLQFQQLHTISPVQTRFIGWLLRREARESHLIFFVDSSVQTYGMTYASSGQEAAGELAKMMHTHRPCPFVIAMPPGVQDGTIRHLVDLERPLPLLSEEGIRLGISALAGDEADKLNAALHAESGIWYALAARPIFLNRLAAFFAIKKRLPNDVRELFRVAVYPGKLPVEQVEAALICLSERNLQNGLYWEAIDTLQKNRSTALDLSSGSSARVVNGLVNAGLLRSLPADPEEGRAKALVCFAHPVFLAYATALSWFNNRIMPVEQEQNGRPLQVGMDGLGPRHAEALKNDPVMADALVFFNNIESDPALLAGMLKALVEAENTRGMEGVESSPFRWFLAAQCLLAMAPAKRPREVVEKTASQLIKVMAYDEQAARQTWRLLEPLDETERMAIYAQALSSMDETRLEQTLRRVIAITQNEDSPEQPVFLRAILWHADESLSRLAGRVWANCEPREAVWLLQDLYERGPAERRGLAIELLGKLPYEAAGEYLQHLMKVEKEPALRSAILKSLSASGAAVVATLLAVLADEHESETVRNDAAGLLAHSSSPELRAGGTVRELARISHMPLPEQARGYLLRLLDGLHGSMPDSTMRWDAVINPFLVGRPVTDPAMFFGREQILRDLRTAVDNTTHVLLTGERGSGKTSLLYRVAGLLQEEAARGIPVRAVFYDLLGLQPHEFYETTIRTIIEGLHDPALAADPNIPRPYTDQHFARDLKDVLEYMQTRPGPHCRLVLLVDHAEVLTGYPLAMHAALRRILEGAVPYGLVAILAGTDPLRGWQQPPPAAPFYSSYLTIPIPRLTGEEASRLVTEPVAGMFQYEASALEHIVQAGQGRPDVIQAVCQKLVSHLLEAGTRTVTEKMVVEALKGPDPRAELLSQSENALNQMMDWLEEHPEAPAAQIEEQMKRTWSELQKAIVQQVMRVRKEKGQGKRSL